MRFGPEYIVLMGPANPDGVGVLAAHSLTLRVAEEAARALSACNPGSMCLLYEVEFRGAWAEGAPVVVPSLDEGT